jgi:hypothetical protein
LGFNTRNPLRQEAFPLSAYFSPAVAGSFNPHREHNDVSENAVHLRLIYEFK